MGSEAGRLSRVFLPILASRHSLLRMAPQPLPARPRLRVRPAGGGERRRAPETRRRLAPPAPRAIATPSGSCRPTASPAARRRPSPPPATSPCASGCGDHRRPLEYSTETDTGRGHRQRPAGARRRLGDRTEARLPDRGGTGEMERPVFEIPKREDRRSSSRAWPSAPARRRGQDPAVQRRIHDLPRAPRRLDAQGERARHRRQSARWAPRGTPRCGSWAFPSSTRPGSPFRQQRAQVGIPSPHARVLRARRLRSSR